MESSPQVWLIILMVQEKCFYLICMRALSYWPSWRRISMCLQTAHFGRTGKAYQSNMAVLLYKGGVKCEPSNSFTVVASILLLHDGNIPGHSNSSAVSGNY